MDSSPTGDSSRIPSKRLASQSPLTPLTPQEKDGEMPTFRSESPTPLPKRRSKKAKSEGSSVAFREKPDVIPEPERRLTASEAEEHGSSGPSEIDDVEKDSDYDDEPKARVKVHNRTKRIHGKGKSPRKRKDAATSKVGSNVRKYAEAADPNHGRCLLTNAPEPTAGRQWAHAIARRTKSPILTSLEWWWQMPFWTLYIDTRWNLIALMATLHLAMDADDFTLVPHHKDIEAMTAWVANVQKDDKTGYNGKNHRVPISESYKDKTTKEPITEFQYYVLPLTSGMKQVIISRYPSDIESDTDLDPSTVEHHYHPFTSLGALTSHVLPHFIIYSAGEKLKKKSETLNRADLAKWMNNLSEIASFGHEGTPDQVKNANRASIRQIISIHDTWSNQVPVPKLGEKHEWRYNPLAPECQMKKQKAKEGKGKDDDEEEAEEEEEGQNEGGYEEQDEAQDENQGEEHDEDEEPEE
ncbi:hypothetical protein FB451DRAFT_629993 [Mycena latifolia]|nr:hypothetical protein FB451DRAFT_629993 [Mycena latifolia]